MCSGGQLWWKGVIYSEYRQNFRACGELRGNLIYMYTPSRTRAPRLIMRLITPVGARLVVPTNCPVDWP
jgi:hypothetical protein